jgi:hypothetical protein
VVSGRSIRDFLDQSGPRSQLECLRIDEMELLLDPERPTGLARQKNSRVHAASSTHQRPVLPQAAARTKRVVAAVPPMRLRRGTGWYQRISTISSTLPSGSRSQNIGGIGPAG